MLKFICADERRFLLMKRCYLIFDLYREGVVCLERHSLASRNFFRRKNYV